MIRIKTSITLTYFSISSLAFAEERTDFQHDQSERTLRGRHAGRRCVRACQTLSILFIYSVCLWGLILLLVRGVFVCVCVWDFLLFLQWWQKVSLCLCEVVSQSECLCSLQILVCTTLQDPLDP